MRIQSRTLFLATSVATGLVLAVLGVVGVGSWAMATTAGLCLLHLGLTALVTHRITAELAAGALPAVATLTLTGKTVIFAMALGTMGQSLGMTPVVFGIGVTYSLFTLVVLAAGVLDANGFAPSEAM